MAKNILSELVVQMTVESASFQKELEKATAKQAAFENQTKKTDKSVINFEKAMGVAAKGVAAFTAAIAALAVSQERQRNLDNYAKLAQTTADRFLDLARAARTVGIENEKLADISKDTLEKLGEFVATGGGGFKDFFENVAPLVGVTAKELQGLSGPDVLIAVKKAMDDANISMEEQSFYLESIASDTTNLIPLLAEEGKQFEELAIRSETLADAFTKLADEGGKALNLFDQNSGFSGSLTSFIDYIAFGIRDLTTGQDSVGFLTLEIDRLKRKASFYSELNIDTDDISEEITALEQRIKDIKTAAEGATSKDKILEGLDFSLTFGESSDESILDGIITPEAYKQAEDKVDAFIGAIQTKMELADSPFKPLFEDPDLSVENIFSEEEIDWTKVVGTQNAKKEIATVKQDLSGLANYVQATMVSNMQIVTSSLGQMVGESSGIYKLLFAIQKAATIPSMIANTEEAYTKALTIDPTGTLATAVKASGYASIGIVAGQTIAGVFHGGGAVPGGNHESTYLLQGGEYVESRAERREIDKMMAQNNSGEVSVNLSYNIQSLDSKGVKQVLLENNSGVYAAVQQAMRKQGRTL